MRNLASIQKIKKLWKHPNADNLNMVQVLDWACVSSVNDNFKEGDLVVYIEVDSVLPDGPEWSEFMRPRKFRVKTIRLRGELSQGLIMPLSILPEIDPGKTMYEGVDVTELLGITKYEIPEVNSGGPNRAKTKSNFPVYVYKTDETRIQSIGGILDELRGKTCFITVKMDGTSATFSNKDNDLLVCSQNRALVEGDSVWWKMCKKYHLEENLSNFGNVAVQGEICGPGIQKNKMGLTELDLFVFNVFDIDKQEFFNYEEFCDFCDILGLKTVPILDDNYIISESDTVKTFVEMAKGNYDNGKPREGIVVRPLKEMYSNKLRGRCSFKAINNDFLEKHKV